MKRGNRRSSAVWFVLLLPLLVAAACKTYIVHVAVVNHTGSAVNLLEVDYPSASFGVDSLPAGATYHYHLQLEDSGPFKVAYTDSQKHKWNSTGPTVHQGQKGTVEIVLMPGGKTEFHPQLDPAK